MQKGTKIGIGIVAVLVVVGLGYWFFGGSQYSSVTPSPVVVTPQPGPEPTPTPTTPPVTTGSPTPSPTPNQTPATSHTVEYTDQGFNPSTITIKKGETVTWVNHGSDDMWVASNPHPIHNGYPESGGCINSVFDACAGFGSGKSYSFTFTTVGKWGYHNHLSPADHGTVVVQ
jgi:plastocyanin